MYADNYAVRRLPEIVTTSGYALIHFYSDIAVNMSGFNISYRYVERNLISKRRFDYVIAFELFAD